MKKLILFLVSIFFISCSNEENSSTPIPFIPVTINPMQISKRNLSGGVEISQQNSIINDENNWLVFKSTINSYYQQFGINYTDEYFQETTIDFNNFIIIAIIDQVYSNGGHSIDITNIVEYETNIVVTVQNLQTGNEQSVVTQPYHIVKIPITTKPIVFEAL